MKVSGMSVFVFPGNKGMEDCYEEKKGIGQRDQLHVVYGNGAKHHRYAGISIRTECRSAGTCQ